MYLFDPFNSPESGATFETVKTRKLEAPVVDQQDIILAEMRARIQMIRNLRSGETIQTPVAFIVGKSDAWAASVEWETFTKSIARRKN